MYEMHYEAKDKLTDLCKTKLENDIRKKMETGISTAEDQLLLEELIRAPVLAKKRTEKKLGIRDPMAAMSDGFDDDDLSDDRSEVKEDEKDK